MPAFWKRVCNKALRRRTKATVRAVTQGHTDPEDMQLPDKREPPYYHNWY